MKFDLKKTAAYQAVQWEKFLLFRWAPFLMYLFSGALVISCYLLALSVLGFFSLRTALQLFLFCLSSSLLFFNIAFFVGYRLKKPALKIPLETALEHPDEYNLAEYLSFSCTQAWQLALQLCKKRNWKLNTTALLHALVRKSKPVQLICMRLGLDPKKLENDLRNFLEKIPADGFNPGQYTNGVEQAVLFALEFSGKTHHRRIGQEELFSALAEYDECFKQILQDADLKKEDVQNLAIWLDSVHEAFEKRRRFWVYENLKRQGSLGKDWASGYTINLDAFSVDWRRQVSQWAFKEIFGHEKEVHEAEMILAKSQGADVLLVGEPGTGRKSIVEALAQKCYLSTSLPELNNKRVVELDMIRLTSELQDFEALENTLDQIFAEVIRAGNVILVIDELQNFVGQPNQKAGVVDISGILAKYLQLPGFQFVGITTNQGLHRNIEQNHSFAELFRKVEVEEITQGETIQALQASALEAEYRHKVFILYPTVREAVNLTAKYMPSLPFPKKALDVLEEAVVYAQTVKQRVVLPEHVAKVVSEKSKIPVGKMEGEEKGVLMNLEKLIHERIVNQEEAVTQISSAMRRARAGLSSKKRPMGSFLFMGPTGVGKTETAKALAQIYFGSEERMIRLDMSEFQAIEDIPRLLGAVSPVEMQGLLTTPVRDNPFSLLLLDEIEKAHPNILNLLLQVLDEGHITDGQGRKVMFTNTIVICTSNAAADVIFKTVQAGQKIVKDDLLNLLFERNLFRPEFVNRFDATVIFTPLSKDHLLQIAGLTMKGLIKGLAEKEITFHVSEELKAKIVELSYKPAYGAREMRRVVQDRVEDVIAQALIEEKIKKGDTIELDPETFKLLVIKE